MSTPQSYFDDAMIEFAVEDTYMGLSKLMPMETVESLFLIWRVL